MTKNIQKRFGQSGMTLVETLVAMAISGLIVSAIYSLFQTHHRIAARQSQTTLMQQELHSAAALISEELRMCGFSAQGSPGFGFSHKPGIAAPDYGRATTGSAVYCSQDWNADGIANENGSGCLREHAGFRLNVADDGSAKKIPDHVLRKYDTGFVAWQPFSTNIGDLHFIYFDAGGEIITEPHAHTQNIRGVRVEITAIPSKLHLGIGNRTLSTMVWCRNTEMEKMP
ncbi:prepilin-type N-terminal cleavage/methylation domain-containing protein [Desulfomicrobium sp. ZS1]|uniref:PilW family protein n=1 Tax=Desulfomicrobium sp. ZS1 TaxID=2952228 RepID=UPI0020B21C6F|nr:prepilin-type N-terminal cleavage/methylation domain-containing protein [Desulfomicrobium sp. ZS1]UTF50246.1 prepilin-type N-terminal cleavage/methylation domain-containing protein [Desulfomicrobium sp. ZS1]